MIEVVNSFGAFILASCLTLFVGYMARVALRLFWPLKPSDFGAFCVTVGFVLAKFSGRASTGPEAISLVLQLAGVVGALALLWYHWFKRPARRSSPDE
jgi:hypothetical protein